MILHSQSCLTKFVINYTSLIILSFSISWSISCHSNECCLCENSQNILWETKTRNLLWELRWWWWDVILKINTKYIYTARTIKHDNGVQSPEIETTPQQKHQLTFDWLMDWLNNILSHSAFSTLETNRELKSLSASLHLTLLSNDGLERHTDGRTNEWTAMRRITISWNAIATTIIIIATTTRWELINKITRLNYLRGKMFHLLTSALPHTLWKFSAKILHRLIHF